MNDLEERLRSELAQAVSRVRPAPGALDQLLRRRRRQWRARIGVAVVTAVTLALAGGAVSSAGSPEPSPAPSPVPSDGPPAPEIQGGPITPLVRQLIAAPTRGNLAGDTKLVAQLTGELRDYRARWLVPARFSRVKLLLLADVGIARVFTVAYYDDDRAVFVDSSGYLNTPVSELVGGQFGGSIQPATAFPAGSSGSALTGRTAYHYTTALAPAGCTIAIADTFHLAAGQAVPDWTDLGADYVVLDGAWNRLWWRFTCGGVVQGIRRGALDGAPATQVPTVTERGQADPRAVRNAFNDWLALPGLPITRYRALWGGTPPGGSRRVVVVAGETGGGVEVCAVGAGTLPGPTISTKVAAGPEDDGQPADWRKVDGVSTGVAASATFVVLRLPDDKRPWLLSDRLLVLAPPGTTQATVTGSVTGTVPLINGVGFLTVKAPATVEVHVHGATARLAEPAGAVALAFGLPFTAG